MPGRTSPEEVVLKRHWKKGLEKLVVSITNGFKGNSITSLTKLTADSIAGVVHVDHVPGVDEGDRRIGE